LDHLIIYVTEGACGYAPCACCSSQAVMNCTHLQANVVMLGPNSDHIPTSDIPSSRSIVKWNYVTWPLQFFIFCII